MWNLSYWWIKWLNAFSISWRCAWDFLVWKQKRFILICWLLTIGWNRVEKWLLVVENGLKWRWKFGVKIGWTFNACWNVVEIWSKLRWNMVDRSTHRWNGVENKLKSRWKHVENPLKFNVEKSVERSTLNKLKNFFTFQRWSFNGFSTLIQRWTCLLGVMMHAEQSYLNRDYSILEQKGRCMPLYHILSWFTIVWFYHDVWFWHVFAEFWHRLHWLKTPGLMPSNVGVRCIGDEGS